MLKHATLKHTSNNRKKQTNDEIFKCTNTYTVPAQERACAQIAQTRTVQRTVDAKNYKQVKQTQIHIAKNMLTYREAPRIHRRGTHEIQTSPVHFEV